MFCLNYIFQIRNSESGENDRKKDSNVEKSTEREVGRNEKENEKAGSSAGKEKGSKCLTIENEMKFKMSEIKKNKHIIVDIEEENCNLDKKLKEISIVADQLKKRGIRNLSNKEYFDYLRMMEKVRVGRSDMIRNGHKIQRIERKIRSLNFKLVELEKEYVQYFEG